MGKNEWFCSLPFHWHFGNTLSLFFHTFRMLLLLFLWGYCFIITTISILLLIHDDEIHIFVYFQVDVHYLCQWIKDSSLLVNAHTIMFVYILISNMYSIFLSSSWIDSSKQVFFDIKSKSSVYGNNVSTACYYLDYSASNNNWFIPLFTPLHVIKHCPY